MENKKIKTNNYCYITKVLLYILLLVFRANFIGWDD